MVVQPAALRLQHLGLCCRLLNEWLINMYCHIEDERFTVLRQEQNTRFATRTDLCAMTSIELAAGAHDGKKYYLPSSVPASPRHLRKMRADTLGIARRKGPPTYFITLTCNPYWSEILVTLQLGQTAADGSGIVVRVFHGRLHKRVDALKTSFSGKRKYYKVIEYQRRGLPHVHIVLSVEHPPTSPAEVDLVISCELAEMGPLRDSELNT